ncbi:protein translocase subunit SecF, partial [Jatrophihabitans sp. YIM 134969]
MTVTDDRLDEPTEPPTGAARPEHQRGVLSRLYRGETDIDFIGSRKRWYLASAVILLICVLSFVIRGFNFGVEFEGGTQFQVSVGNSNVSTVQVEEAVNNSGVTESSEAAQEVGSGSNRSIIIKTATLSTTDQQKVSTAISDATGVSVSTNSVSSTWGSEVTDRAIIGLIVFLVLVSIYLAIWFQWRMAVGAIVSLLHDLVVAAGIYSLVGFEVTPSTVVGLLTILGFSLYDTVVVFDKIRENTRDITAGSRTTYSEAANLAVNQTLMRSINTTLISLLPVGGLLFVGAGLLGVGTIKDLALILFVGLASGAYSSLFLAAPIVCELTERQPAYRALTRRVLARRAADAKQTAARDDAEGDLVAA